MPSEPLASIVLRDYRDERGRRYIGARREPDGSIVIDGQDLGRGVESAFGTGLTEYEWTWRVEAAAVPAVVVALGGSDGDDPLPLLAEWSAAHGGMDPGSHLKEAAVPIAFSSRIGD